MSGGKLTRVVVLVLAVCAAILLVKHFWPSHTDERTRQEQAAADSLKVAAERENTRLEALAATLADSVRVHTQLQATYKASADAKAARIAYLLAHPKVVAYSVTPGDSGPPVPGLDTLSSCEERYELRTGEAHELRLALGECDQAGKMQQVRADTLATANGRLLRALQQSDSARKVEIARPRPCRINLLVVKPSCGTVILGGLVAGFATGVAVSR